MDDVPLDSHSIAVNWPTFLQMTGLYTFHARASRTSSGGVLNNFVILLSIKQRASLAGQPAEQRDRKERDRDSGEFTAPLGFWPRNHPLIAMRFTCLHFHLEVVVRHGLLCVRHICGPRLQKRTHMCWKTIRINVLQIQCRHRVGWSKFLLSLVLKHATFALSAVPLCWWPTRDNIDMEKNFRNNFN